MHTCIYLELCDLENLTVCFTTHFSGSSKGDEEEDGGGGMGTTSIVIMVLWQLIITGGLVTVCGCYISRRYKSKNTVQDEDINFTDLEKIDTARSSHLGGEGTVTQTDSGGSVTKTETQARKVETKINWVTSTTTTRSENASREPPVARKSVRLPPLPQKSTSGKGPTQSKSIIRKSIESSGPYTISNNVPGPSMSTKQSIISMVLESFEEFEV